MHDQLFTRDIEPSEFSAKRIVKARLIASRS